MKPKQGKELTHFIKAFIRTIKDHSNCERKKYPSTYEAADPTDIILDSDTVQKITPTVRRWRSYGYGHGRAGKCPGGTCDVNGYKEECKCIPISDADRIASAFTRPHGLRQCYQFFNLNSDAFFSLELVKTLLLFGEMDAILRICALPGVELDQWWSDSECMCANPVVGWDQLCIKALRAYICLNTIYCFPKIWDSASGKSKEMDYRNSKFYQLTLRTCTGSGDISDVSSYPHRQFFGISDNQFRGEYYYPRLKSAHWLEFPDVKYKNVQSFCRMPDHYGKVPIDEFLTLESETMPAHQPNVSDIQLVRDYLYQKGLPSELVLDVMEIAGYRPVRRLSEPHDPFHPSNREELARYLTFCWRLLVNCDVMAKALHMELPWEELLGKCLADFWADDRCGKGGLLG